MSQFDQVLSDFVMLSAARVPASRDERKSKHPEDVSCAYAVSGSSLESFFPLNSLLAEMGKIETVWVEFPDATWQRKYSRDGSIRPCSPSQAQGRSGFAHHDKMKTAFNQIETLPFI